MGVPTMYIGLLAAARADDAPAHPADRGVRRRQPAGRGDRQVRRRSSAPDIYEGYGLSETSPVATFNQAVFGRKPGTVGRADLGHRRGDRRARDRGPHRTAADRARSARWCCAATTSSPATWATRRPPPRSWSTAGSASGDLGRKDADGFLSIVDRKKDLIIRGGFNVYPREVEEVLAGHPGIAQVAVLGFADEAHGEEICAVVVRAPEGDDLDAGHADRLVARSGSAATSTRGGSSSSRRCRSARAGRSSNANWSRTCSPTGTGVDAGHVAAGSSRPSPAPAPPRASPRRRPTLREDRSTEKRSPLFAQQPLAL